MNQSHSHTKYSKLLSSLNSKQIFFLKLVFILVFLFPNSPLWAQTELGITENLYGVSFQQPLRYEGSPYLFENWRNCKVYLKNGKIAENVKAKFSILTNDLIYYNNELKSIFKADKNTFDAFVFNPNQPDSLLFINYQGDINNQKIKKTDLVEVLHQGKITFWAKHTADVIVTTELNGRDKIFPKHAYFIVTENDGIEDVALRVSSITKALPEYKKEIKAIAKENRIKGKSERNIAKLVSLLNMKLAK